MIGVAFLVGFVVLGIPSIIAGVGLLGYRTWARWMTVVLCALDLTNVPLGTALGVYGLWAMLSNETEVLFQRQRMRVA